MQLTGAHVVKDAWFATLASSLSVSNQRAEGRLARR